MNYKLHKFSLRPARRKLIRREKKMISKEEKRGGGGNDQIAQYIPLSDHANIFATKIGKNTRITPHS